MNTTTHPTRTLILAIAALLLPQFAAQAQPTLLTPVMTSNTAPAPNAATASSSYDGNYQPFRAFDQLQQYGDTVDAWASSLASFDASGNGHAWLMIDLGSTRTLTNYILRPRGFAALALLQTREGFPRTFSIQVSTDGVNFTTVDTRSDIPLPDGAYQPYPFTLTTPAQARFIKIDITKVYTDRPSEQATIGELELYGYDTPPPVATGCLWTQNGATIYYTAGKVGIGTANPTQALSVSGTIRAKEIIVDDTGWADYVFDPAYPLQTLDAVEQHIKTEKHLPGLPSAQDIAAKGVSLGDMQTLLLAKIEELTLYQIAQEKRLRALEQENATLKSQSH